MKKLFSLFVVLCVGLVSWGQVTDPTFSPADGATGVSLSPVLTATFDGYSTVTLTDYEAVVIRNITTSSFDFILTTNTAEIYTSGNVLTIDLTGITLNEEHEYAIYVPNNDVINVDGQYYNELQNYTKWSFTTVPPLPDPTFSPLDNTTGVSTSPTLTATFDGYSAVSLTAFENVVIYNVTDSSNEIILSTSSSEVSTSGNVMTIDLSEETLSQGDEYAVYIPGNDVINVDGQYYNELQNYTKWSFTTSVGIADPTFSPLDNATGVSLSPTLTATFDTYTSVSLSAFQSVVIYNVTTSSNEIILNTSNPEVSTSGNVLTIDLSGRILSGDSEYAVYIPNNDVINVDGQYYNELQNHTKWSFTTGSSDPTFSPLDDATGVSQSPTLTATFEGYSSVSVAAFRSIVIYNVTTSSNEIILNTSGSEVSTSGNVLTIDLSGRTLIGGNEYAVYVPQADVISYDGNYYNELQNYTKWSFTVVEPPTDPTFSPLDNSTGVSTSPTLTATFDDYTSVTLEAFKTIVIYNITTSSNEIILSTSDTEVSTSGNVMTIDLSGEELLESNEYAVYFPNDDVINVDGQYYNELQNFTKWSFTTANALTDPTFSPLDDATGVLLSPTLTATFDGYSSVTVADFRTIVIYNVTTSSNEIILSTSGSEVSTSGNIMTIDLTGETLLENNEYAVYFPNDDVINVDGQYYNELQNYTKWSFTTALPVSNPTFSPLDNSTDVSTSPTLTATFDGYSSVVLTDLESVVIYNVTTASNEIILTTNTSQVSTSGNVITIDLSSETLIEGNEYAVYIPSNDVIQVDGQFYNGLQDYTSWSFTTIDPISDPTFSPLDNANDVSTSPTLTATFEGYSSVTLSDFENVVIYNVTTSSNEIILYTNSSEVYTSGNILTIDLSGETLLEGNEYAVYIPINNVIQVDGQYYNELQNYTKWSFTTTAVYREWLGENSDFTDTDNWSGTGNNYNISATPDIMPIISDDVTVDNIIIEAGASLEITSLGSLTVNGTLTLESSTTGAGNASLIDNGHTPVTISSANVNIQQQINASNRTYYVSSPVDGATKSNMGVDNAIGSYDNVTDSWNWLGDTETLTIGTGYALRTSSNLTFTGEINSNNSYEVTLTRTDGQGYGWNLVGNPYPAALNWDLISSSLKTNIFDAYWIFLNDATNYGVYATYSPVGGGTNGLDNLIPSNQGYFVKVSIGSSTGSLTMPKSALKANTQSVLKSGKVSYPKIKLAGVNGNYKDETIIAFADIAEDVEDNYDASKRFGSNSNYMELYSHDDSENYAINCRNELWDNLVIPLGYKVNKTGTFVIKVIEQEDIFSEYKVMLEDILLGEMINLNDDNSYSFTTELTGKVNNRFALHFISSLTTDMDKKEEQKKIKIYSNQSNIYISAKDLTDGRYEIYNTNGRLIMNGKLQDELNTIATNLNGIYIVKVIDKDKSFTDKVLLK